MIQQVVRKCLPHRHNVDTRGHHDRVAEKKKKGDGLRARTVIITRI